MTVKKLDIPGYDPRASFTQALGYMTSPSGACHLRGGYAVSLAFFGGTKEIPVDVRIVAATNRDLEAAVANRAKAKERTGLAQENARLVDVAYKAGAATYLESTDSVQTLRQAEVGLVAESLNVDLATLKLLNAVGAFEEVNR